MKINDISSDDIENSQKGELRLFAKFRTGVLFTIFFLFIAYAQFVSQGGKRISQHEDAVDMSASDKSHRVRITNLNIPAVTAGYVEE